MGGNPSCFADFFSEISDLGVRQVVRCATTQPGTNARTACLEFGVFHFRQFARSLGDASERLRFDQVVPVRGDPSVSALVVVRRCAD